ncbi:MAG: ankyrin repeat domain-containing protein [Spirochaetales bacterium]|nr:ankyrin repeat domain-containing protein [Spirochaetales bacterium]
MKSLSLLICLAVLAPLGAQTIHDFALSGDLTQLKTLATPERINARDPQGRTPLLRALEGRSLPAAEFLLARGADPDLTDNLGNHGLHYAVRSAEQDLVRLLLSRSNQIATPNNAGLLPIDLAMLGRQEALVDLLRAQGSPAPGIWNHHTLWLYITYLVISLALTVWVATTLFRNGRIFLVHAFRGNEELADSINRLLVVGFYLINVGYVTLALKTSEKPWSLEEVIESLSVKIGLVLLILGGMHFFNLFMFGRLRKKQSQNAPA